MLVELGKMSKEEREKHTWFGVYLWETRKKGKGYSYQIVVYLKKIINEIARAAKFKHHML
jgi:hypothetical protein